MPTISEAYAQAHGLQADRLLRVGEFFVDTGFVKHSRGPRTLEIDGRRYWRFMDFFYSPRPVSRLRQAAVVELCEIRRRFAAACIDLEHNTAVAARVGGVLASTISKSDRVLDFGCGDGLSMSLMRAARTLPSDVQLVGVDLSEAAVISARAAGFDAYTATLPLPFAAASFDAAYALFVMHFDVDASYLAELWRVLRPGAFFCFNIYNAPSDRCRRRLLEVGFEHPVRRAAVQASRRHDVYCFTRS